MTLEEEQKEIDNLLKVYSHWNHGAGLIIPEYLYEAAKKKGIKLPENQVSKKLPT